MAGFWGGAAIGAGFRLIGREPLAFLAWTVVYAVVAILPQVWIMASFFSAMPAFAAEEEMSPQAFFELQSRMMIFQPVSILSSLLSYVLITGAVFRAVLQPEDRRFLYLRLGPQELWLGLVGLVIAVLFIVLMLALMIPMGIVIGIAAATTDEGAGALVAFPLILLVFAAFIWLGLRVSLALPMSFDERNFRLPEALRMSRGHVGKMFLVGLALSLIVFAVQMVLFGVAVAIVVGAGVASGAGPDWPQDPGAVMARISPVAWATIVALWALIATFSSTLFSAAWASIYRDLRDSAADDG